jgi:hypothetical protein
MSVAGIFRQRSDSPLRQLRSARHVRRRTSYRTSTLGRTIAWNNTFQYRVLRKFWPEVELNSTFFQDGKNDGRKQNLLTPGLVMGRFRLVGRVGFTVGGGYQIATSQFHITNHNAILSIRFPF